MYKEKLVKKNFFAFFSMRKKRLFSAKKPTTRACAKSLLRSIDQVLKLHIPIFFQRLEHIADHRKHKEYKVSEIIMAGIFMFIAKSPSRNNFNILRSEKKIQKNYKRLFNMNLPHLDTVEDFMRLLEPKELELLTARVMASLIEKKTFYRFKFLGSHYCVAIDGTGVNSYSNDYCGECLSKVHKNKTTFHHMVLEAKLVCSNGLTMSLGTEWIENSDSATGNKQDCELNAFKRLAVKIKKNFPRLPITILADGLYPNQSFFKICQENNWNFILTFKDGSLKTIQEEIMLLGKINAFGKYLKQDKKGEAYYNWTNNLDYQGHCLNWVSYEKIYFNDTEKDYFVYITNLEISRNNVQEIVESGRMRWNIEIHGFDHQKNHGYNLGHKFSRVSYPALKNYYQCMQLSHIIEQLALLSLPVASMLEKAATSIRQCWERIRAYLMERVVKKETIASWTEQKIQLRLI